VSRLPPLPYAEWDLESLADASPGMKPPPLTVLELFAHHPALARAFLAYNRYLNGRRSTLPPRVRELAILRVAWRRRCRYEWAQHVRIAAKAGVTPQEIALVRAGDAPGGAGGAGTADALALARLVIGAVDELDDNSRLSDQTYQALAAEFGEQQLMDLVFTIGTYVLLAMAFNAFGLELDPGLDDEGFDTTDTTPHLAPDTQGTPQKGT
jgi:AhpD family alkylhydroperoxidase